LKLCDESNMRTEEKYIFENFKLINWKSIKMPKICTGIFRLFKEKLEWKSKNRNNKKEVLLVIRSLQYRQNGSCIVVIPHKVFHAL
jgi:predicted Fe-S protein YdhL (DUF1289 family)